MAASRKIYCATVRPLYEDLRGSSLIGEGLVRGMKGSTFRRR
jgi:hypothetical protein